MRLLVAPAQRISFSSGASVLSSSHRHALEDDGSLVLPSPPTDDLPGEGRAALAALARCSSAGSDPKIVTEGITALRPITAEERGCQAAWCRRERALSLSLALSACAHAPRVREGALPK